MTYPLPANMKGDLSNLAEMVALSFSFTFFSPSFASNCGQIFKTGIQIC